MAIIATFIILRRLKNVKKKKVKKIKKYVHVDKWSVSERVEPR